MRFWDFRSARRLQKRTREQPKPQAEWIEKCDKSDGRLKTMCEQKGNDENNAKR
jgi:hypothetical protein